MFSEQHSHSNRCLVTGSSQSDECSSTGTVFTEASGTVLSPGYFKGNYPNNANCKWRIETKENMVSK